MQKQRNQSLLSVVRGATEVTWYALFVILGVLLGATALVLIVMPARLPLVTTGEFTIQAEFLSFGFQGLQTASHRLLIVGTLGATFVALASAQAIVAQLRKVLGTLAAGSPFSRDNARRVRIIGYVIIAGAVANAIVGWLVGYFVMATLSIPGVHVGVRVSPPITGIFLGLVVALLSAVFQQGTELQEDQDLTV